MVNQEQPKHPVTAQVERFLDHNNHSLEALQHVKQTLEAYEWFISLATQRAITALYIPENVVQVEFGQPPQTPPQTGNVIPLFPDEPIDVG